MSARAALLGRVAGRYRSCGRFAFHYVGSKLRHDPLTDALLELGATEHFGEVVDLGCGRGQFAGLLLEAGLARRVIGLEANAGLLDHARHALSGLQFEGRQQNFDLDTVLPPADTVLILDVLYQLPTATQLRVLQAASHSAAQVVIRTADPALGMRAWMTRLLERAGRGIWPHSGALVNARPPDWIARRLEDAGLSVAIVPCSAGTPFGNVLLTARRRSLRPSPSHPAHDPPAQLPPSAPATRSRTG